MKASELIEGLRQGIEKYGDLEVTIGSDDRASYLYYYDWPGLCKHFWISDSDRSECRVSHEIKVKNESE